MKPVSTEISFPKLEERILAFWRERDVFYRSMNLGSFAPGNPGSFAPASGDAAEPRAPYIFYDGPPFATGLPHYGHLLAGTIKDVVGRFFTMKGFHVDRRFGWDCHGVPVEFEIQKSLKLEGAKDIRAFGIDRFNEECRKIVLRYTREWRQFVERSGRWVDFEREYRTMDRDFMESIWWVLKSLWNRGFVYEGLKCVSYSCGMNTPLSNFEANLNYKTIQDPAVTVRARLADGVLQSLGVPVPAAVPVHAYIWTTTPWTLPSNMALAVQPSIAYVVVNVPADREEHPEHRSYPGGEIVIVAADRAADLFPELGTSGNGAASATNGAGASGHAAIVTELRGDQLVGLEYLPFFPFFEAERAHNAFRIYPGDFVTAAEGTGIVHLASFGEDDLSVFKKYDLSVVDPIDEDGKFDASVPIAEGLHFKEADPKIIAALKESGALVTHRTIEHAYPFCWRTDTPLIYRSVSSWFVRVESIRDLLLQTNSQIHWVPEHIKEGRFGKWLENARDWAISRDRFWGTPIPIWRCDECDNIVCIGSVAELEERSGECPGDLHSHFIDRLTFTCERCQSTMRRIPQVLDCWFESGAMPYAQAHYPFEHKEEFDSSFPADFIAEGLDQTRGWFYTLLVLSTALFGRPAFRNVVVNGIVLAEDGKKMSKSLKNYPPPGEVMDELGADAMRLYLLASAATRGEDLRFSKEGVKHVVRQTLLPLWNAYNFFVTYALVDGWTPEQTPKSRSENLLDRWILSKVGSLIDGVDSALGTYHLFAAAQPILEFVDQLTNWYIRLNRRRFWVGNSPEQREDKLHAYATLHRALVTFVRVLAPLAPFISDEIYRNLSDDGRNLSETGRNPSGAGEESVHLTSFPRVDEFKQSGVEIDQSLEKAMELFEEVILLARTLRNDHGLKVRQPLAKLTIVYAHENELRSLERLSSYIQDELNVKAVEYTTNEEDFVSLKAKLNTKRLGKVLGPKLGRDGMRRLQQFVESLTTADIRAIERGESLPFEDMTVGPLDVLVERTAKRGLKASASSGQVTIVLDTNLTQELRLEGLAREFVNRIQKLRKDLGFEVTDRIVIGYMTACPRIQLALIEYKVYVMEETLAVELHEAANETEMSAKSSGQLPSLQEIDGKNVIIAVSRTQG